MDEYRSAATPPDTCRSVILNFGDNGERDCVGFWWAIEKSWYKRDGSKRRSNAVHPTRWKEVAQPE